MRVSVSINTAAMSKIVADFESGATRQAIAEGIREGAFVVQSKAQQSILAGGKSGRVYGKRKHRASAPGEPPANDTGTLVRGITITPGADPMSYVVDSTANYAEFLELGTSKMAPRPYLLPAAVASADMIATLVANKLKV